MTKERRDTKNRILRQGEYQRKDGRYEYKYSDLKGRRRSVYSWKLVMSDKVPADKDDGTCLREMEKQIEIDAYDSIDTCSAKNTTLNDCFEIFIKDHYIKADCKSNYIGSYNKHVKNNIGSKYISEIKRNDLKNFYNYLRNECDLLPRTINGIDSILNMVFRFAIENNLIRTNPASDVMREVAKGKKWAIQKRMPLTNEEQGVFVDYCSSLNSPQIQGLKTITLFLLGTGCRVGEAAGLTWNDVDFRHKKISINRTLRYQRDSVGGKFEYHISEPKTLNGIRDIPMFPEIYNVLKKERDRQIVLGIKSPEIDGETDFVFINNRGGLFCQQYINIWLKHICEQYNKTEMDKAESENREPILLPHFTCHILRHTFCTRMCENVTDNNTLNVIKEIMGHSSITTTINVYSSIDFKKKQAAFDDLVGKVKLS